jgi:hypothetical protein
MKQLMLICALLLALSGCATLPYAKVEEDFARGAYGAAAESISRSAQDYGSNSRLLFLMDQGMALHLSGDAKGSTQSLEKAYRLTDALYGLSVSKAALSMAVNDQALDYVGEDYERVMISLFAMLNQLAQGDPEGALVEARRMDARLNGYVQAYGDKQLYREDALARYLSACIYESEGQLDDAYLDYKKTREAFIQYNKQFGTPEPGILGQDLLRLSLALNREDDAEAWRKAYPMAAEQELAKKGQGEILAVLYDGLAPVKEEYKVDVPLDGRLFFSMAFPRYHPRGVPLRSGRIEAEGSSAAAYAPLQLFEDINAIAVADLKARIGRISVKAIARATAKFVAGHKIQEEAEKSGNMGLAALAFVGTNIYNLASERADLRSWRTLPGRIHLARLRVPAGEYKITYAMQTQRGARNQPLPPVRVEAGKLKLVTAAVY